MTTYYVAKTGNDNTGTGTSGSPFQSIRKGIQTAIHPGDVVLVHTGVYLEQALDSDFTSGAPSNPITISSYPGETVIWRPGSSDETSLISCITFTNKRYITISGFYFHNIPNRYVIRLLGPIASGVENKDPAAQAGNLVIGIIIENNTFAFCGNNGIANGISTGALSSPIQFNATGMPSTYTGPPVSFVRNNVFDGCWGFCIQMTTGAQDTDISRNIIKNTHSSTSSSNAYGFFARGIHSGGSAGNNPGGRHYIHHNVISNFIMDSYSEQNTTPRPTGGFSPAFVACGVRLDVFQSSSVIEDNIIHDMRYNDSRPVGSNSTGMELESSCSNNIVRRNIIYRIGGHGIEDGTQVTNTAVNNQYLNNTIFDVDRHGIFLNNSKNTKVKSNIIHIANGTACINAQSLSVSQGGLTFEKNCYYRAGQTLINTWNGATNTNVNTDYPAEQSLTDWSASSGDTGSINIDPQFVDSNNFDFDLAEESPAKFIGTDGKDLGANPDVTSSLFKEEKDLVIKQAAAIGIKIKSL